MSRGFTLLEMLVATVLIGIVALLSVPTFTAFGERNTRTAAVNHLYSTLAYARQLAISEQITVSVCATNHAQETCLNGWHGDILVLRGNDHDTVRQEDIERVVPAMLSASISYTRESHRRAVKFNPLGFTKGYNGRFHICPTGSDTGSTLVLSQYGRLRLDDQAHDCR